MGRLYFVEGTMRQDQYKKVLETRLLPQIKDWFADDEGYIFMQDGAPCHTAKSIRKFLEESNIPVLDWPGNSPDMNPIENVWEFMKRELAKDNITTKRGLMEKIIFHWNHNDKIKEVSKKCIKSMGNRVRALMKAKGATTKY